jgi:hypothetical protein
LNQSSEFKVLILHVKEKIDNKFGKNGQEYPGLRLSEWIYGDYGRLSLEYNQSIADWRS